MSGMGGQLEVEESRSTPRAKTNRSSVKTVFLACTMALSLIAFAVLCWEQHRLEWSLGTTVGSVLHGRLLTMRTGAGSAGANLLYLLVQMVPENNGPPPLQGCLRKSKELVTGLAASFEGAMVALSLWQRQAELEEIVSDFQTICLHYFVSAKPFC